MGFMHIYECGESDTPTSPNLNLINGDYRRCCHHRTIFPVPTNGELVQMLQPYLDGFVI